MYTYVYVTNITMGSSLPPSQLNHPSSKVHRATLWSGEDVVVKVQRPGLKQLFDIDLENLKILAEQLDKQDENK